MECVRRQNDYMVFGKQKGWWCGNREEYGRTWGLDRSRDIPTLTPDSYRDGWMERMPWEERKSDREREMCGFKEEEYQEEKSIHNLQNYQEQLFLQYNQQMQQHHHQQSSDIYGGERGSGLIFPEVSPILPWPLPPAHSFNPAHFTSNHPVRDHDPFLIPPPIPSSYGGFFNRRSPSLQFAYDGTSSDQLRIISDTLGPVVQPCSTPFGLQAELSKMTAQEIMDAKALAASKSHSEAERRRRERINNHLAKLRSLLPSTTKTDKASLLAEVIQHVKELKRQTSLIAETSPVPTEMDELTVDTADEDGKFVLKASLCCEDRSDLLPDLIKTLKALRLRTLKAEITTLGGRVKNVLFIAGEDDSSSDINDQQPLQYSISSIQEALKSVMEKTGGDESSSGSAKRQRTNLNILQQQHRSENGYIAGWCLVGLPFLPSPHIFSIMVWWNLWIIMYDGDDIVAVICDVPADHHRLVPGMQYNAA
uniref:BHLH domain-containing protein n=1 Tax=Salix viminalis TaxID=40686 RepID=A0A6N2MR81_SALVM